MKLAVITSFPPSKVTLNEYGYHLVKNFVQKEEVSELILMCDKTNEAKQLDFDHYEKVKVNECWSFNSYKIIFTICKAVITSKPDAILFNLQFVKFGDKKIPAALGLLLPFILRILGFKTMVLMHNILEQVDLDTAGFTKNKLMQNIYNAIGSSLTFFILKSNKVSVTINKYVEILKSKYKVNNVILIPHGSFETISKPNFDLPSGPRKIMAFGKFGTYKKVEILIEALQEIRKIYNDPIEVVIAGTNSPNTPGYLENIQKKYSDIKGLIFTGYVQENDVEKIFTESTVVVFPYTSTTGSSGVLHQAGSYGKAVVLPNLGDLALLIEEEGYKGEFFESESVESLTKAIHKILKDDNYRKELAYNNYKVASTLTMDKIADKYLYEINQLINTV
ncbi:glycosyltransferase [Flavobacterium oreochromis]|uniref:Glycosyl transferase family 1 n=2 Tax=Flavobacterium TaxID=237 RepID=A0A246GAU1_9FLAO|nr:glycosyltransferase [Flavobacterium oreochromis]OWP74733.1 glycosyl transferase family 1 [Flavobacterium oreochromis]OWP77305.1 glycosyl transferase family 1 [Flavobacterium oreochromis]POR26099.1 glycosyl transferase family 1 [Flavobacterium columnare]QYS87369.1 glycosyltransferase [Flavobacterium oreochromis]